VPGTLELVIQLIFEGTATLSGYLIPFKLLSNIWKVQNEVDDCRHPDLVPDFAGSRSTLFCYFEHEWRSNAHIVKTPL
jgi:hypothetical protein